MHVRTSGAGLVRVRGTEWGGARERSGERACGDAPGHDLHRGREVRAESEGAVVGLREAGGEVRSDIVLAAIGGSRAREWTFAGAGVWPFPTVTIRKCVAVDGVSNHQGCRIVALVSARATICFRPEKTPSQKSEFVKGPKGGERCGMISHLYFPMQKAKHERTRLDA